MRTTLLVTALLMLFASCQKEEVTPETSAGIYRFDVYGPNQSYVLEINGEVFKSGHLDGSNFNQVWTIPHKSLVKGDYVSFDVEWIWTMHHDTPRLEVFRDSVLVYQSDLKPNTELEYEYLNDSYKERVW